MLIGEKWQYVPPPSHQNSGINLINKSIIRSKVRPIVHLLQAIYYRRIFFENVNFRISIEVLYNQ